MKAAAKQHASRAPAPKPGRASRQPSAQDMGLAVALDAFANLRRTTATAVKTSGWSSVAQTAREAGAVVVTSHNKPDAVVLSPEEFSRLKSLAEREAQREQRVLDELNARFDARIEALQAPGMGRKMADFMQKPVRLNGRVRAGEGH